MVVGQRELNRSIEQRETTRAYLIYNARDRTIVKSISVATVVISTLDRIANESFKYCGTGYE